ncbi:MAG: Uma2 family endonuclease [Anaerolineae bacterium]|nr:Uma2 family endonuclease [Caldilineales bacterium]MCX7853204.1 Uma2 family endonuclease [Caldilineales bacterium]MDW8269759.1 Uma2 family endonuclease [Anaerolineae bacterium]
MPASLRLSLAEFLALPEAPPRYEFEEGALIPMPQPHSRHQKILLRLAALLDAHIVAHGLGSLWPEIDVILPGEQRVYAPDLVYLRAEHLDRHHEGDGRIHGAPDLVVEILSPSTRLRDRTTKLEAYQQAGVPWYWLVDQDDLTVEELELTPRGYLLAQVVAPGQLFRPALFPELSLDLAAMVA